MYGRHISQSIQAQTLSHTEDDSANPGKPDPQDDTVSVPSRYIPCSRGPKQLKLTSLQLHWYFGYHRLDYRILPHCGSGLKVPLSEDTCLSVGDVANIHRTKCGSRITHSPEANHTVGADIGYGDGTSPGVINIDCSSPTLGPKQPLSMDYKIQKAKRSVMHFGCTPLTQEGFQRGPDVTLTNTLSRAR